MGEGEAHRPKGHQETGDAALLHRQLCLRCYGEQAADQIWPKGSEKWFNGGWLLISNQHIITESSYQLKPVSFSLSFSTGFENKNHHSYLLDVLGFSTKCLS